MKLKKVWVTVFIVGVFSQSSLLFADPTDQVQDKLRMLEERVAGLVASLETVIAELDAKAEGVAKSLRNEGRPAYRIDTIKAKGEVEQRDVINAMMALPITDAVLGSK